MAVAHKLTAKKTMQVMGYIVVAEGGWIVRKHPDGKTEKVSKLKPVNRSKKIALD